MVGRQGYLHESSGVVTPGAISDSMSAVPEGFSRYWLARGRPVHGGPAAHGVDVAALVAPPAAHRDIPFLLPRLPCRVLKG